MRLFIIILITISHFGHAQIVASSCSANDSIKALYIADAQRILLNNFITESSIYVDSANFPSEHVDTILNALIAVYNATGLEARDSVIEMYDIHTFKNPSINRLLVEADSTLPWMQQLKNSNLTTGNVYIDSIIDDHELLIYGYNTNFGWYPTHTVFFESDSNYNFYGIGSQFLDEPGVTAIWLDNEVGDGNYIYAQINLDHVALSYRRAWGDCLTGGCMYSHIWEFKVYYDCTVEYVGSQGDDLFSEINEPSLNNQILVFPNPTNSLINMEITAPSARFVEGVKIVDNLGRIVPLIWEQNENTITLDVSSLSEGQYRYHLVFDDFSEFRGAFVVAK